MKFSKRLAEHALAVSMILGLLSARPAYAYIDPGTGSYVIQVAIASVVGALFAAKMFGKKTIAFINKIISSKKRDDHDAG